MLQVKRDDPPADLDIPISLIEAVDSFNDPPVTQTANDRRSLLKFIPVRDIGQAQL